MSFEDDFFFAELKKRLLQQKQSLQEGAMPEFEKLVFRFSQSERERIAKAVDFAMSMDYSWHPGSNSKTSYMNHPFRMATLAGELFVEDKYEGVTTSLVHNILEVTSVTEKELSTIVGERIAETVAILTVDRNRQKDPVYKTTYYRNIENQGLVASGIKVLDKYDNLFLLGLNPDEGIRKWYLEEIDKHVIPLARICEQIIPGIEKMIVDAAEETQRHGFFTEEFRQKMLLL